MLIVLTTLLEPLRPTFRSRAALELENLALRHQIGALQGSAAKRLKLTSADPCCGSLSRLWHDWRSALPSSNPKRSLPGIVPAFACSGPGRCGAANRDDL